MWRLLGASALLSAWLPAQVIDLPLDRSDATWQQVTAIGDGVHAGAARFAAPGARIDAGPCPVSSRRPFTLRCALRTARGDFCTPLMARDGEAVGLSLVLGRRPGCISFEAWSWRRVRLIADTRIDDGAWHRIEVAYDPLSTLAILSLDGRVAAMAELGHGDAETARLRLGDNIGAHQPYSGDIDDVAVIDAGPAPDLLAFAAPVLPRGERQKALADLRERLLPARTAALAPTALGSWPQQREQVRRHVRDALGLDPWPERPPLDVQVHGALERDGVVVERVSFQAFTDGRATGWLWRPAAARGGRHPAVLCPHGHWPEGGRAPIVQRRCASFAKFGWTALVVDSVHIEAIAAGVSPIGTMTWHNLRALELLAARPDVDPERIAATGCSGGAQQTYYLMALAEQLAAAAPICMACYFREIIADESAHCGCNHVPRLAHGTDVIGMCAVFAPRPAFFGSVTGDWTRRFPEQGLPELRSAWTATGAPAALRSLHRDEGHDYSQPMREAVYAFLHEALAQDPGAAPSKTLAEPAFAPFDPGQLAALGGPAASALADDAAAAVELLARRPRLTEPGALAPGLPWRVAPTAIEWRGAAGLAWRPGVVRGEDRVPVPFVVQESRAGPAAEDDATDRWVVIVPGQGKAALLAAAAPLPRARQRTAVVDPRGFGEWQPFAAAWRRNGLLLGRGELYQAAHDVALVCESLPGQASVTLVGLGAGGYVALVAATLSPRVHDLLTDDLGPTYEEQPNREPLAPELLRLGGWSQFARALDGRCDCRLGLPIDDPQLELLRPRAR